MCSTVNKIKRYLVEVENISPFRIGNGDEEGSGILLSNNYAVINGTTLAGLFREFLMKDKELDEDNARYKLVFPPETEKNISNIYFFDAMSTEKIMKDDFVCRTHIKIDKNLGVAMEEHLYQEHHISQGKKFNLTFEVRGLNLLEDNYKKLCSYVEEFIWRISNSLLSIGSKSTFGFGKFKSIQQSKYYCMEYDLLEEKSLNEYLEYTSILKNNLCETQMQQHISSCEIIFEGYCEDGFIIKSDEEQIKNEKNKDKTKTKIIGKSHNEKINGEDKFIIPSSTIKGIVRNYSYKIYETLGENTIELDEKFGRGTKEKHEIEKGKAIKGILVFNDCQIEHNVLEVYNRIKIDRFTGSVMNGQVFADKLVIIPEETPVEFKVGLKQYDEKIMALLILAFRDIGLGYVTVGSGNNVGCGRFNGLSITINKGNNKCYKVKFKGDILEGDLEEFNKIVNTINEQKVKV